MDAGENNLVYVCASVHGWARKKKERKKERKKKKAVKSRFLFSRIFHPSKLNGLNAVSSRKFPFSIDSNDWRFFGRVAWFFFSSSIALLHHFDAPVNHDSIPFADLLSIDVYHPRVIATDDKPMLSLKTEIHIFWSKDKVYLERFQPPPQSKVDKIFSLENNALKLFFGWSQTLSSRFGH